MKRNIHIILFLVCVVAFAYSNRTVHAAYMDNLEYDFEAGEGYSTGELNGQDGWVTDDSRVSVVSSGSAGAQSGSQWIEFQNDFESFEHSILFEENDYFTFWVNFDGSWDDFGIYLQNSSNETLGGTFFDGTDFNSLFSIYSIENGEAATDTFKDFAAQTWTQITFLFISDDQYTVMLNGTTTVGTYNIENAIETKTLSDIDTISFQSASWTSNLDYVAFDSFYSGTLGGGAPVPEPSTILLLLFGICGLGWKRFKK